MEKISPPTTSANSETTNPLTMTGSARPRNSGTRGAGVARMMPSVSWRRSSAMVLPIANRHGIAAYCNALPMTKNSSEPMPAARPM